MDSMMMTRDDDYAEAEAYSCSIDIGRGNDWCVSSLEAREATRVA